MITLETESLKKAGILDTNLLSYTMNHYLHFSVIHDDISSVFDYVVLPGLSNTKYYYHDLKEKEKMIQRLSSQGIILFNADWEKAEQFLYYPNVLTYSIFYPSDMQALHIRQFSDHYEFDLLYQNTLYQHLFMPKEEKGSFYDIYPFFLLSFLESKKNE